MNISEVIKNRTSLRVYDDRMIEDQDLEKILEAASLAPTAGNQQLYSIIVIKSQETKDKLSESCDHQPFIAKAPVLLLFVSDQKKWFDYYQLEGCKEFSEREPGLFWEAPDIAGSDPQGLSHEHRKIGRASCRERVSCDV